MTKEVVIYPTKPDYIDSLPLLADIQFLEPFSSEALNRKNLGVIPAAIYRGFDVVIAGDNAITIGDDSGKNTAIIERDNALISVQGQHPVSIVVPYDMHVSVVIEAVSQHGLVTQQIDTASKIPAAQIKILPVSDVEPYHVVICEVMLPAGGVLTEEMIDKSKRIDVDLLDKYTKAEINHILKSYTTKDEVSKALEQYVKKQDLLPNVIKSDSDNIALNKLNIFKTIKLVRLPASEVDCFFRALVDIPVSKDGSKQSFRAPDGKLITIKTTGTQDNEVNIVTPHIEYLFTCIDGEWYV
ncbi:hypothetical protein [Vibrio campbellii]|uniref:hypothetical protein n=1 Tax=Vibrio campbellii TaxID=680 RepID=UPI00210D447C|nr:hypothetical protein [Vibrio campbellii]UTZ44607.1 hypothetical protein HB764_25445 [Vibrio campbellii]